MHIKILLFFALNTICIYSQNKCFNPDFEAGNAVGYDFYLHQETTDNPFNSCIMEINKNIPLTLGALNDYNSDVSLVDNSAFDPTMLLQSVQLPRINPNTPGNTRALRLNTNNGGRDIATMTKTFIVTSDKFVFNFAAVIDNPSDHGLTNQPFFQTRIIDSEGNLIEEYCIQIGVVIQLTLQALLVKV